MILFRGLRFNRINDYHSRLIYNYFQNRSYSYEGDGKTTVSFLSRDAEDLIMINGYSKLGFRLTSGLFTVGPVIVFPRTILSWNVANDNDINEDSLSLFCNLEPSVDVLVIGLGNDDSFKNQSFFIEKLKELKKLNFNVELLPTVKAISTYNFLCAENRFVAAALIPPIKVDVKPPDMFSFDLKNITTKDEYFLHDDSKEIEEQESKHGKRIDDTVKRIIKKEVGSGKNEDSPGVFQSLLKEARKQLKKKK